MMGIGVAVCLVALCLLPMHTRQLQREEAAKETARQAAKEQAEQDEQRAAKEQAEQDEVARSWKKDPQRMAKVASMTPPEDLSVMEKCKWKKDPQRISKAVKDILAGIPETSPPRCRQREGTCHATRSPACTCTHCALPTAPHKTRAS